MRCTALQALPLGDEISDICSILDIMIVPAAVQKLPVVPDRDDSYKNNHVPAFDQMLRQGLVVVRCWFDAKDDFRQTHICLVTFTCTTSLTHGYKISERTKHAVK